MAAVHEAQVANKNTIKPSVMKKCNPPVRYAYLPTPKKQNTPKENKPTKKGARAQQKTPTRQPPRHHEESPRCLHSITHSNELKRIQSPQAIQQGQINGKKGGDHKP